MKFKFMPPALIFYTKLPDNVGGKANGPVIRIKPKYKDDKGIHAHELEHVKQWYYTIFTFGIWYWLIKRFRLWAEVKAYQEQLKYSTGKERKFAEFIATGYNLNITQDEAHKRLMED